MKVEFANRAVADLLKISAHSRNEFGERVTAALEVRFRKVIDNIGQRPESAPRLENRPDLRVVLVGRYPFKIFYRVLPDRVRILHVRHTARQPWTAAE
jgi:plasmid stabilization system protein ParE